MCRAMWKSWNELFISVHKQFKQEAQGPWLADVLTEITRAVHKSMSYLRIVQGYTATHGLCYFVWLFPESQLTMPLRRVDQPSNKWQATLTQIVCTSILCDGLEKSNWRQWGKWC